MCQEVKVVCALRGVPVSACVQYFRLLSFVEQSLTYQLQEKVRQPLGKHTHTHVHTHTHTHTHTTTPVMYTRMLLLSSESRRFDLGTLGSWRP